MRFRLMLHRDSDDAYKQAKMINLPYCKTGIDIGLECDRPIASIMIYLMHGLLVVIDGTKQLTVGR